MKEYKRKHERYDTLNLLSYVSVDSEGKEWSQGMGRTLNISENGMKLETHEPVDTRYTLLLSIGMEDEVVDIKGKVVYCNRGAEAKFESGIEFKQVKPDAMSVLQKYIKEFHKQFKKQ